MRFMNQTSSISMPRTIDLQNWFWESLDEQLCILPARSFPGPVDSNCGSLRWRRGQVGIRGHIGDGAAGHFFLAGIREQFWGVLKRNPEGACDFDPHCGGHVVDAAGLVAQQVKTYNLENLLVITPGTDVNVLAVDELGDQFRSNAGLLPDLT